MRRIVPSLIIIGDSWGCGEWGRKDNGQYSVLHKGIEQYCIDYSIPVTNFSSPGANNFQHFCLFRDRAIVNETIFWFITCPLRDLSVIDSDPKQESIKKLHDLFENISEISEQHNLKIFLLGGLCDLNSIEIDSFRYNFEIVIPSVTKFLDSDYSVPSIFGDINSARRIINKHYALDVFCEIEKKFDFFRKSTDYPDNGHPGRFAHQKIFQFIRQYV